MSRVFNDACWKKASELNAAIPFTLLELRGLAGTKKKPVIERRTAIAKGLRDAGFSYPEIADALGMDHSGVLLMMKREGGES